MNKTHNYIFIFILICFFHHIGFAQLSNDDCYDPINISNPKSYCSGATEFSNVGAGDSGYGPASCWNGETKDVWFSFVAQATAVNIVVNGNNKSGGQARPQAALYQGVCGGTLQELDCDTGGALSIDLSEGGLTIGEQYLIRINGMAGFVGNFQLCVTNFNPPKEPDQDCITGVVLCNKETFVVKSLSGVGKFPNEGANTCLEPLPNDPSEDQSTWYKWIAATDGTLTFSITPLNSQDDIDFAIYELPNGINDCAGKIALRCDAASCDGPTGLSLTSTDLVEDQGCEPGEDLFVKNIDMVKGKAYALLINNFDNTGIGFKMEWGGTGLFEGPIADFTVNPSSGLRCDQDFSLIDISTNNTGTIKSYEWNFGVKSTPSKADTKGPHKVNYYSFGQKYISLTIESSNGCKVTKVKDLYAEPCCDDLPKPSINSLVTDVLCNGEKNGIIDVSGQGNYPDFYFKINDGKYTTKTKYSNLAVGNYELAIQDAKGCRDSVVVLIKEPEKIVVNAGEDFDIELGDPILLNGAYTPVKNGDSIFWRPPASIEDPSKLSSSAIPPGNITYILYVKDAAGCIRSDSVLVRATVNYEILTPNIILEESPSDGIFSIVGLKSAKNIDLIEIYDRWGNKVYKGTNLNPFDRSIGWDGTFNGKSLEQGVYAWVAHVRFVDDKVFVKSGNVTLVRKP